MTEVETVRRFRVLEEARDFALEEYKSLREEQLMRVKEMDTLLFRAIGVCTVLYSVTFVDLTAVLKATGGNPPDIDGRVLRYLVCMPPVIILLGWADYWRRLFTLILCGQYLARLEAAVYAPRSKEVHKAIEKATCDLPSALGGLKFWAKKRADKDSADKAVDDKSADIAPDEIDCTLGYDIYYIYRNRFGWAGRLRHGIWLVMLLLSVFLIWAQFCVLASVEASDNSTPGGAQAEQTSEPN